MPNDHLNFDDSRNVGQALMMQDFTKTLLVSAQFFRSNFLFLIVFQLQFCYLQSPTFNASLVEAFSFQLPVEGFLRVKKDVCLANNIICQEYYLSRRRTRYAHISQQGPQIRKESYIFSLKSFFFFFALLRVARQSISSFIYLVLVITNMKIVTEEHLSLPELVRA